MAAARSRFRIHLSTAICLMLVAAVLLWLNFTPFKTAWIVDDAILGQYGWPWRVERIRNFLDSDFEVLFSWSAAAMNCAVAATILCASGFVCEWFTRRRETPTL